MTERERFLETMLFGTPDRVPIEPGNGRRSTRAAWHAQGLPHEVEPSDIPRYAFERIGSPYPWPEHGESFPVNERMIPEFEEKVLEVRENSQIVQDWKGNICEIGREYTTEYLRNAIDFVTRRWIKCPVESWDDWDEMKARYDPDDPSRLPDDPAGTGTRLEHRSWPISFRFSGPFWQMREWLGFEQLCTLFYDDPDLIRDMVGFWTDYVGRLLENALAYCVPDEVHLSEDMAYKKFSMISPAMAREFLMPAWDAWGEIVRAHGVPVYAMDSDGYIGELIPLWIDAGINACDPIEVAAGNDIEAFREQFGTKMAYRGGVDKRAMAAGGEILASELARIEPVVKSGGYIPSCDHGIPADVSWPNYLDYVRGLARLTGWL
jgi:uroporphyrinogen decarboxylase